MEESAEQYLELMDHIDFAGFDFGSYAQHEIKLLQPQLEAVGYTRIRWMMGDYDSFGPLTRICRAINPDGKVVKFVYG